LARRLTDQFRLTLATALMDTAGVALELGDFDAAADAAGQAAGVFRNLLDGPVQRRPDNARMFVGMAATRMAAAERARGRTTDALAANADAVAVFEAIPEADRDRNEQHMYARALEDRGRTYVARGDSWPQAEQDFTAAIDVWDKLKQAKPATPFYREWQAAAYEGRGGVFTAVRRYDRAAADLDQSRSLAEALIAENDAVPSYHARLGRACAARARLAVAQRDALAAADWFRRAAAALGTALAADSENALTQQALRAVQAEQGEVGRGRP
jgi:tetratricopeptide (TPR) repeat protein